LEEREVIREEDRAGARIFNVEIPPGRRSIWKENIISKRNRNKENKRKKKRILRKEGKRKDKREKKWRGEGKDRVSEMYKYIGDLLYQFDYNKKLAPRAPQ
jgi:hypothetical protein